MIRRTLLAASAFGAALLAVAAPLPAAAHVTLDRSEMPADSSLRITLRVPHGCEGAATTGIRVQIPAELREVKPMPLAGWTLNTVLGDVAVASAGEHGAPTAPVREVSWRGGNLPDAFYGEFVMRVRTPAEPGGTLVFPIVQECENGKVARWIERRAAGGPEPRFPAYLVRITPKN
ncbi:YcnI family protein [Roseomonas sp. BN140053]|uniref:YcnI family protein n=1 Tax=Roseomonas sp. BN140053 TaxID=3391898 RepID=UPI0039E84C04